MITGTQLIEKFLFKIAKQWIAGNTIDDALISAKNAYKSGRHAIINKLGEYHTSKKQINTTLKEYQKIVKSFRKWKIRGAISIKPTQIGLSISQKECYRNFKKIIQDARNAHVFVWLDVLTICRFEKCFLGSVWPLLVGLFYCAGRSITV